MLRVSLSSCRAFLHRASLSLGILPGCSPRRGLCDVPWKASLVSSCGTHHVSAVRGGQPLYNVRFESVLPFHAPGLAPVLDSTGAYHVDGAGEAAYDRRFARTFGYYQGLAAVEDKGGLFHHVLPSGEEAFSTGRAWEWCGNFQQGRCVVRRADDGAYFHISQADGGFRGGPYLYAGDFREGAAVARLRDTGRCVHVDRHGGRVHGGEADDLDVFHKGMARARDARGWFHMDRFGEDASQGRRYEQLEPFYNGQAAATTVDGERLVVDECGAVMARVTPPETRQRIQSLLVSYWAPLAVRHGLRHGLPRRVGDMSELPAASARALENAWLEVGLLQRGTGDRGGVLEPTEMGRKLMEEPFASRAHYWLEDILGGVWLGPRAEAALAAGSPGGGRHFRPGGLGDSSLTTRVLAGYEEEDFGGRLEVEVSRLAPQGGRVADLGGGAGGLMGRLARLRPDLAATVCDTPSVVRLSQEAVRDIGKRGGVAVIPLDLWPRGPPGGRGGDAARGREAHEWSGALEPQHVYVLCRVLHDWDDERVTSLLRRIRRHGERHQGTRLVVVERCAGRRGHHGLLSLHMHLCNGGRERTASEFRRLFAASGWALDETPSSPVAGGHSFMVLSPAPPPLG